MTYIAGIFSGLIFIPLTLYVFYRYLQHISYLNFKIKVLQQVLYWKFVEDKKIFDKATDYVLDNDNEYKHTIRAIKKFSKTKDLENTADLLFTFDNAVGRFYKRNPKLK